MVRFVHDLMTHDQMTMCKKEVPGHQIPLHPRQLSSVELQASPGKQVAKVSQSCQQHIPAGFVVVVVVVVVVAGAHFSSQPATQEANTAGFVGQSAMQVWREPPGQSSGVGDGVGAGVVGACVVVAVQSALQTPMQASNAAPVTTAQAALQAAMEPPGH